MNGRALQERLPLSGKDRVFRLSALIIIALVAVGASFPDAFGDAANTALSQVTHYFGWFYLMAVFAFVIFLVALAMSKYGKVRLGPQDSTPTYGTFSWISMLLAAGFGVGLVFYGMAEPMTHYIAPPYADMTPESAESARYAIQYSFFNWGIHQWAAFALVGLIIAYYQFRKEQAGKRHAHAPAARQGANIALDLVIPKAQAGEHLACPCVQLVAAELLILSLDLTEARKG